MSKIILGKTPDGHPVAVDLELLLRSRLLIVANSGGGKSWAIRRLIEQLFGKVQIIVLDREGDFPSLCDRYDFLLVGEGHDIPADVRSARMLAEKLLELRASAICDLYEAFRTSGIRRMEWVREFLMGLVDAPKHLWHDVVVIVDEAHLFSPQVEPKGRNMEEREIISGCKDAMIALATVGRKRGLCGVWATQRLAKLDKDASAELLNRMVGMTMEDQDVDRAVDLMSVGREDKHEFRKSLRDLEPGQFYAFGRAIAKERVLVKVGEVRTRHEVAGGSGSIYEPPPPSEKVKSLLAKLADLPKEAEAKARTEKELRTENEILKRKLAAALKQTPVPVIQKSVKEKKVEVPVLREKDLKRLETTARQVLEAHKEVAANSEKFYGALLRIRDEIKGRKNVLPFEKHTNGDPKNFQMAHSEVKVKREEYARLKVSVPEDAPSDGNGQLDKCNRSILSVLAQYPEGCSIGKVALLAGYKRSGTFMSALSNLRTRRYLEGSNSGIMKITDPGLGALGKWQPLPEGPELAEYWVAHPSFDLCERKILKALIESPDGLTIEEICERTGYERSGTFMSALSALRTAGVLEGRNSEKMKAAEDLVSQV